MLEPVRYYPDVTMVYTYLLAYASPHSWYSMILYGASGLEVAESNFQILATLKWLEDFACSTCFPHK